MTGFCLRCCCLILPALTVMAEAESPWTELLALDHLNKKTAQMPTAQLRGMGKFPRRTFEQVWDNWLLLDQTAFNAGKKFLDASGNLPSMLSAAAGYNDCGQVDLKELNQAADAAPSVETVSGHRRVASVR